jgi:hypothetical protein
MERTGEERWVSRSALHLRSRRRMAHCPHPLHITVAPGTLPSSAPRPDDSLDRGFAVIAQQFSTGQFTTNRTVRGGVKRRSFQFAGSGSDSLRWGKRRTGHLAVGESRLEVDSLRWDNEHEAPHTRCARAVRPEQRTTDRLANRTVHGGVSGRPDTSGSIGQSAVG